MHSIVSKSILALLIWFGLALTSSSAHAGRLFFSTSATSPVDVFASETNPTINVLPGQSFDIYIWYERYRYSALQSNGDSVFAISMDIASSNPIVENAGFTVDNPHEEEFTGADRWTAIGYYGFEQPTATMIVQDSNTLNTGVSFMGWFFDPGRDPVTSAIPKTPLNGGVVRYATLTLQALSVGTTEIRMGVGAAGIVYFNDHTNPDHLTNFGWGDAAVGGHSLNTLGALPDLTINVVPEPSSMVLLAAGLSAWSLSAGAGQPNAVSGEAGDDRFRHRMDRGSATGFQVVPDAIAGRGVSCGRVNHAPPC